MKVPSSPFVQSLHAIAIYAEPLVAGRRVALFGDSSGGLGPRLMELRARAVHVFDPDGPRARREAGNALRGVVVRELPAGDLDVRDGAFDLAIIADLGLFRDAPSVVARTRRLVGADGAVVVATANPEVLGVGTDYYELYELLSLHFARVRMIGEVSFGGVAIVDLAIGGDAEVSVDTQLSPQASPFAWIALASQRDVALDPYSIIQLPVSPSLAAPEALSPEAAEESVRREVEQRVQVVEAGFVEERKRLQRAAEEASAAMLARAREELLAQVRDVEARAGDNHVRAERLVHDIRKLEEELERQRERAFRLTRDLEDERKARTKAELELGMVRKNPEVAALRDRVTELEGGLRGAGAALDQMKAHAAELEQAVAKRDQELGRILDDLEEARAVHRAVVRELEACAARAEGAEQRVLSFEEELARHADGHAAEFSAFEKMLRDRAQRIKGLEAELARRERLVQELVSKLERAGHHGHIDSAADERVVLLQRELDARAERVRILTDERDAMLREWEPREQATRALRERLAESEAQNRDLREALDRLALGSAEREGDAQGERWRVEELEHEVEVLRERAASAGATGALVAEMDALRQALVNEHQARSRLESGEVLASTRSELARQAVLVEQLKQELARVRDKTATLVDS